MVCVYNLYTCTGMYTVQVCILDILLSAGFDGQKGYTHISVHQRERFAARFVCCVVVLLAYIHCVVYWKNP